MNRKTLEYLFAIMLGIGFAVLALAYFDVLTK